MPVNGPSAGVAGPVDEHLARLLSSPSFSGSKRAHDFLEFVVRKKLDGKEADLKERTIGVELFGRAHDYVTSEDAIVRVKANDARKRLAQYYQNEGAAETIRIQLPAGSYVPVIEERSGMEQAALEEPAKAIPVVRRFRLAWAGAVAVAVLSVVGLIWATRTSGASGGALADLWRPLIDIDRPALIVMGSGRVALVSWGLETRLLKLQKGDTSALDKLHVGESDYRVNSVDWFARGDFDVAVRLAELLGRRGKAFEYRRGELSLADISGRPIVVVGAFNNNWTLDSTNRARFTFRQFRPPEGGWVERIVDSKDPGRYWEIRQFYPDTVEADYAVVTRILDPANGKFVLSAAGMNMFGTQAAGFAITNESEFSRIATSLPSGWRDRNFQIVLRTRVVNRTPNPPEVLASHVW